MNLRQLALVAVAALAVGGTAAAQAVPSRPAAAPPTPPPPQTGAPGNAGTPAPVLSAPVPAASATPTAAPAGRRRGRSSAPSPEPSASETPAPPQFQTLDGVWEVQLQPLTGTGQTIYSHLYVTQKGDQISGHWTRDTKEKVPFTGTFDGRLFQITAKGAKGDYTMSGYIENFSDAVGMLKTSPTDQGTPFTASHRKKEKFEAM